MNFMNFSVKQANGENPNPESRMTKETRSPKPEVSVDRLATLKSGAVACLLTQDV